MGFDTSDDACVYRVREDLAVVQTVDFFPPMVDDPTLFGQIAAANALSDIYAMGGAPAFALNIVCFPSCLPPSVLHDILRGGGEKVKEAGAVIAGGHSIDDSVPKYGLCVTGFLHPDRVLTNSGARAGDVLILSKPIGSGIINTAVKADLLSEAQLLPTFAAMATLNKYARDVAEGAPVRACTDITGFGLIGHTLEMAEASGVTIEVFADSVPLLPYAEEMAKEGAIPAGAARNRAYAGARVMWPEGTRNYVQDLLFDPQTSGGLLFSVPEADAAALLSSLLQKCPQSAIVGRVTQKREECAVLVQGRR